MFAYQTFKWNSEAKEKVAVTLKSDYNYSARIVYNNFSWCNPDLGKKRAVENTAQVILDARALYPQYTLAEMYDPLYIPKELLIVHQNNDRAVIAAYGIAKDNPAFSSESSCVALLMEIYQEKIKETS